MQQKTGVLKERNPNLPKPDGSIFSAIPESAGPRLMTFRGGAIHSVREPGALTLQAETHLAAVMLAPAPKNRAALGSDRMQEYDAPAGALVIHPANVEGRAIWSCIRESVIVALTPESLQELAAHELDAGRAELQPPPFGTVDPSALHVAQLLKGELTQREAPNELYVDSLITILGVHLLRNYTAIRRPMPTMRGGLSVRAARRVKEFMDENFSRKLSVAELAAVTGLSPRHFIQAFTQTFGERPHRYLVNRRLAFAEELLVRGSLTIAEVAELSGFSDQSQLTTSMKKYRQVTPMQVRRSG